MDAPVVLVETVGSRQMVAVASTEAESHGIRAGMPLAEARAICPALRDAPCDPQRDRRALEALGRWMMRFSPTVAVDDGTTNPAADGHRAPASAAPAARQTAVVFLDVTGCERLFRGLANLTARVDLAMRMLGLRASIATAPTAGAAYALASCGKTSGVIVGAPQLREALVPLPVESLRIDADTAAMLHQLGIHTAGRLFSMPRDQLVARFGQPLIRRIDQVLGRIDEPLPWLVWESSVQAAADFDAPLASLEAIWTVTRRLLEQIAAELRRRGRGAKLLKLELCHADGPPLRKNVSLAAASRDPDRLFPLLRCAIDSILEDIARPSAGPNFTRCDGTERSTRDGFTGIHISVPVIEKMGNRQMLLTGRDEYGAAAELDQLLEKLVLRLGDDAVVHVRPVESHIPEKAYAMHSVRHGWQTHTSAAATAADAQASSATTGAPDVLLPAPGPARWESRPLCLLPRPDEICVMVSPSHDRDGRPVAITHRGTFRRVACAIGPERIAGQWWEGHNRTRDYFIVETEDGLRWWLFRVRETGRWYMHGQFC